MASAAAGGGPTEVHKIATYNMSFMSDKTDPIDSVKWASEYVFLAQEGTPLRNPENRRDFWKNALTLLEKFLEEHTPSIVGLQEMNLSGLTFNPNTGTHEIDVMLLRVNSKKGTAYKQLSRSVPSNDAGLSIIYDSTKVGEIKSFRHVDNPSQSGRPLLMALTTKNYLLVTIHGAQDPKLRLQKDDFNAYMNTNNKMVLEKIVTEFLTGSKVGVSSLKNIFITGDLNDRYDTIKDFVLTTGTDSKTVTYSGTAPKSCCHNYDSCCAATDNETDFTCKEQTPPVAPPGKLPMPVERGVIGNYKYTGDKVFGLNPVAAMEIYNYSTRSAKVSTESDHELVFATFGDTMAGGRRKKTRKANVKKSKKSRKH